jgi:undecaprenyl-diphosphatase
MTLIEAVLLGLIQGLTEFIPISSTAHLTLAGKLLGIINHENSASWTEFIAIMQLGTLAAVIVYFFADIRSITFALLAHLRSILGGGGLSTTSPDARVGWFVVIGTFPVAIIGLLFDKAIHGWFTKSTHVIVASLIGLAVLLWIAEIVARHVRTISQMTVKDSLVIGIAQAMALIPGSSRSGTTITAGLFLGLTREAAARFSFLLSIPAVLASGIFEMRKIGEVAALGYFNLAAATIVAGVSGYLAIAWLLKFVSRNSMMLFVWYRIGLGILLTLLLMSGHIQP